MTEANPSSDRPRRPSQRARGSNYNTAEDVTLPRACIRISADPITGSEQRGNTFYGRVYRDYKTLLQTQKTPRSLQSITNRLKSIIRECTRLAACHDSIVRSKPSGTNDDDVIGIATALFNNKKIEKPQDDYGKAFRFLEPWNILRPQQKFMAGTNSSDSGDGGVTST